MKSASMFGEISVQIIQYRVEIYYIGSLEDFVTEEGWRQALEWKTECCQTSFDTKTLNERHCKKKLHFRAYRLKILQEIKTQEFWKADSLQLVVSGDLFVITDNLKLIKINLRKKVWLYLIKSSRGFGGGYFEHFLYI